MVFVYHAQAAEYRRLIRARFPGLAVAAGHDRAALARHFPDADVVIAATFPMAALDLAKRLRWIQCVNAGVDFLVPARDRLKGVVVTNASGIHGEVMADYVMAAFVMLLWDFRRLLEDQKARRWTPGHFAPLAEKTVGVVGLGAVGRAVAARAKAAGMTVVGVRRRRGAVAGVDRVYRPGALKRMLGRSDFVVLAVPATPETRALIGAAELEAMKRTAFLVNVARGSVVDERALAGALRRRRIAGACLDVFAEEPLPKASPLWALDNAIVTPHISGNPARYPERVTEIFADNLRRWLAGRPLRNVVDLKRGY
jgi:phosphoglycerate dehydrogenase-like enzyme